MPEEVMKAIPVALAALAMTSLGVSCTSSYMSAEPPPQVQPRTSASDAIDRIVATRCERARRCAAPSDALTVGEACKLQHRSEVSRNFADNRNCVNGVSEPDLEACLANIRAEGCSEEDVGTGWSCRSRQLCVY
jgi:hypothetical protein